MATSDCGPLLEYLKAQALACSHNADQARREGRLGDAAYQEAYGETYARVADQLRAGDGLQDLARFVAECLETALRPYCYAPPDWSEAGRRLVGQYNALLSLQVELDDYARDPGRAALWLDGVEWLPTPHASDEEHDDPYGWIDDVARGPDGRDYHVRVWGRK